MLETERQKQSKMIENLQTNASNTKDEMVRQILFLEKENEVLIEVFFVIILENFEYQNDSFLK